MFNFKKGLIFLSIICIALLTVSFVSAEDIDNNVVSIEDDSLSDISAVDNQLSSSNIESQSDLISVDSDSDSNSDDYAEDDTIKADLKATKLNTTYKSGKYFTFKAVESGTNNPVPYASLKLRVYTGEEYKDYNIDSNENGIAKFKTSSLSVGSHKVVISDVDDFIDASSITSSIKINKAKTVINAPKVTTTFNKNSYFKITVKNKAINKVVSGLKLKLKVYTGKKYKTYTVKTNSKGVAKFETNKLGVGTHKVKISTSNKNYIVNSKSSIVIKKAKTYIKAPKVTTKIKKSSYFKVTVKNKAINKVVSGLKLKLKVYTGKKYKTYTVKTNSKGVAKFKTNKLGVGTHKVKISTSNKNYIVNSKSSIVIKKVKKKTTKKSTSGSYVGSQNSDVFHYSSCASAKRIKSYNKITFSSRSNAIASGYRPCYRCHP